jgi:hypothetical protein
MRISDCVDTALTLTLSLDGERDRKGHGQGIIMGSGQPSAITCAIAVDAVWLRLKCKFAILRRRANSAVFP